MDAVRTEFENLDKKNEIITTDATQIHTLDTGGTESIKPLFDYFISKLVIGLMIPQEMMGLDTGSSEASSRTRERIYQKLIRTKQRMIESQLNTQLIDRIVGKPGVVRIKFNESVDAENALRAQWTQRVISALSSLQRIYLQAGVEPPLEREEVRKILSLLIETLINENVEVEKNE